MYQGCVSDTDGKKPTRKRERHTSNLLGLVLVNEESIIIHLFLEISDQYQIPHLVLITYLQEQMIMEHWYSHYYMCVKKSKRNKNLSMILSKAKGNFALMRTEFDEFD